MSMLIKLFTLVIPIITSCKSTMEGIRLARLTSCTCPEYTAVYECTVMGGQGTFWRGTAINCENSANGILLLHSRFESSDRNYTTICNDGAISGRGVSVTGAFYTSQLRVSITVDLIGKTIECASSNRSSQTVIHTITTPYPSAKQPSLSFVNLELRQINISWSPVTPNCPAVHYNILASNCGSCPTTTNHTTITCVDIPTDGSTCAFAVRVVICGNVTGNVSDEAQVVFKGTSTIVNSGCVGATASASIFAIGLTISIIVFTSIMIIVLIKANKRAHRIDLATRRRARLSRYEEEDPTQQPRTIESESTINTSIYDDMDYEIAKVAVMATNKNIAYADTIMAVEQTDSNIKEHEYAQIH